MEEWRMTGRLDILCRVVDNYGDIGVVYRLARAMTDIAPDLRIRLVVDGLHAFARVAPGIDPDSPVQEYRGWTVLDWRIPWPDLRASPPGTVVEAFACGRPDWYEEILFDSGVPGPRRIVDLEHLSAETWVDEVHRMPSLTRSPLVRKDIFLPGFSKDSGGLILDRSTMAALSEASDPEGRSRLRSRLAAGAGLGMPAVELDSFWILVFSYEHDYRNFVRDIGEFSRRRPVTALVAPDRGGDCFLGAWRAAGEPFPVRVLPFLPQERWDAFIAAADFRIVRGEDSLSRAALAGGPFLWHAYLQEGGHQIVKTRALLDRMAGHFRPGAFDAVRDLFLGFNDRLADSPGTAGSGHLLPLLSARAGPGEGFASFSRELVANGDLASRLLTFLQDP